MQVRFGTEGGRDRGEEARAFFRLLRRTSLILFPPFRRKVYFHLQIFPVHSTATTGTYFLFSTEKLSARALRSCLPRETFYISLSDALNFPRNLPLPPEKLDPLFPPGVRVVSRCRKVAAVTGR